MTQRNAVINRCPLVGLGDYYKLVFPLDSITRFNTFIN